MDASAAKRAAAEKAVSYVEDGMIVGLGTGSTANFAIEVLGQRVRQGLKIQGVPSSMATEQLARKHGIVLLSQFTKINLTIDGADEIDRDGNLMKGGGGALTREKIVAAASETELIIVDESKLVSRLGAFPLPVEVLPFGWTWVRDRFEAAGTQANLRQYRQQAFLTDNGNYILDCELKSIDDPALLDSQLNTVPGVIENGLFVGLTDRMIVGRADGEVEERVFKKRRLPL